MLFWIIGGFVVVSAAFFLSANPIDPWPGLNAAGAACIVYLTALLLFILRKPFTLKARVITVAISIIAAAFIYSSWTGMEEESRWQRSQLLRGGSTVNRQIIASEIHSTYLLPVFERYHQQDARKKVPLGEVFRQMHPDAVVGANLRALSADSVMVFLVEHSNDHVTLVGQAAHFPGRNLLFENFDGRMGMVQARATLTERGVSYEQEN